MTQKRISYILPDHLKYKFGLELDERLADPEREFGAQTKILTEALEMFLKVYPPDKAKALSMPEDINRKYRVEPEAIAAAMEPDTSYTIRELMETTGLSRTSIRRLLMDNPHWFKDVDPESYIKSYELAKREPKKKRRTKRKGKPAYKPNTLMEKTREARKDLEMFDLDVDNFDEHGNRIVELVTYVDLGKGRKRQLGYLEDEIEVAVFEMRVDKIITQAEHDIYLLKYYYEDPKQWKEQYEDETVKLKKYLKKFDDVESKVEGYLEEYLT